MAKRLDGKKVAAGLLAAAALYYFGGLIKGAFDDPENIADDGGGGGDEASETPFLSPGDADQAAATQALETPLPRSMAPSPVAPPSAPAQPTSNAAPPLPSAPSTASASTAKDNDEGAGGWFGAAKWFKNLSPGAQAILGGGAFGSASMTLQALAQKNAMEFSKEQTDRAREDKVRRGAIQPFSLDAFRKGA